MLVLRTVSTTALRAAWVACSRSVHPDKCELTDAKDAMQKVNRAWDSLKSKRSSIDESLMAQALERRNSEAAERRAVEARSRNQAKAKADPKGGVQKRGGSKVGAEGGEQPCGDTSAQPKKKAKAGVSAASSSWETPGKDNSAEPASKKHKAGTGAEQAAEQPDGETKCGMYTIKVFKAFHGVKSWNNVTRKFKFEEWHSSAVAFKVATEFAKVASDLMFKYEHHMKKKSDKIELLKLHGLSPNPTSTIAVMKEHFEKAEFHIPSIISHQIPHYEIGGVNHPYKATFHIIR